MRSVNKVILIGNVTRDPELRMTPSGTAVCSFGLATNRSWKNQHGEIMEDTEYHKLVAWDKLAEICQDLITKGRKIYVEGRLATKGWTDPGGIKHTQTEVVMNDVVVLDSNQQLQIKAEA